MVAKVRYWLLREFVFFYFHNWLPGNFSGCYGYIAGHDTSLESLGHEVHHDILVAKVTYWLLREFSKNALPSVAMDILPNMIAHWKA